jgi:hypothetical protein
MTEEPSALKPYPVSSDQQWAVVGLIATVPSDEMKERGETLETQFILKLYGHRPDKASADKYAIEVHQDDPDLSHFCCLAGHPLPIPIPDSAEIEDLNDNSAVGRRLKREAQQDREKVSEMQRKCEVAVEKGKAARKHQKKKQERYVQKKTRIPVSQMPDAPPASEGGPVAGKREGDRPPTHVFLNRAENCWELVGLDPSELVEVNTILSTSLGQRLLRLKDGKVGCHAEIAKMMASWVEAIRGLPQDSLKVYINAPGEQLMKN